MFRQDNIMRVLVGGSVNSTGVGTVTTTDPNDANYLAAGEIVAVDELGRAMANGVTFEHNYVQDVHTPSIGFVMRSASAGQDSLVRTPLIRGDEITHFSYKTYTANAEQVTGWGYNGTSGDLDVSASNDFLFKFYYTQNELLFANQNVYKTLYYQDAAPANRALAQAIATQASNDNWISTHVFTERLSDIAANGAPVAGQTVTRNSATVTLSAAPAAVGAGIAAGDIVGLPSISGTPAYAYYEVISIDVAAQTMTLDQPYQGTSGVKAVQLTTPAAGVDKFGIRMTAKALTNFKAGYFRWKPITFAATLEGFGATGKTVVTAPVRGQGTGEQIQELEWFAQGNEGIINRVTHDRPDGRADAVAATNYDTFTIGYRKKDSIHVTTGISGAARGEIVIAIPTGAGSDMDATIFETAGAASHLFHWFASLPSPIDTTAVTT